jgi:hypothetical protein
MCERFWTLPRVGLSEIDLVGVRHAPDLLHVAGQPDQARVEQPDIAFEGGIRFLTTLSAVPRIASRASSYLLFRAALAKPDFGQARET